MRDTNTEEGIKTKCRHEAHTTSLIQIKARQSVTYKSDMNKLAI